jgi:hypothetical protein
LSKFFEQQYIKLIELGRYLKGGFSNTSFDSRHFKLFFFACWGVFSFINSGFYL